MTASVRSSRLVRALVFLLIWFGFVAVATYTAIGMFIALAPADLCGPGLECSQGPSPALVFASHAVVAVVSFLVTAYCFLLVYNLRRRPWETTPDPAGRSLSPT